MVLSKGGYKIKQIYQTDTTKLYNIDCMKLMSVLPDNYIDLIITDPPYNIGKDFGNDSDKLSLNDYLDITYKRLEECKRVLKNNGSIIWFASHNYVGYIQVMMYELGLTYQRQNIWHYENGMSRQSKTPVGEYEPFLWFSKSENDWVYNIDDVRVPYKTDRVKKPIKKKRNDGTYYEWIANPKGKKRGDIWKYDVLSGTKNIHEKTKHPTQKPENLITDILKAFCPKNKDNKYEGIVCDLFVGSGTTLSCCEKLNKEGHKIKSFGSELSEEYCNEIIIPRLEKINTQ